MSSLRRLRLYKGKWSGSGDMKLIRSNCSQAWGNSFRNSSGLAVAELAFHFRANRLVVMELPTAGGRQGSFVRNPALQEITELGGKTVGRITFFGIDQEEGRGHQYSHDSLLEGFDRTERFSAGLDEFDNGVQLPLAKFPTPGAFRDGPQNPGRVLHLGIFAQQCHLAFWRPAFV